MQRITARSRKPAKRQDARSESLGTRKRQGQGPRPPVLAASSTDAGYGQRSPAKAKAPKAKAQRPKGRGPGKARHRYWLTPKAWAKRCSHCSAEHAVAVRPADHKAACAACVDRLGIHAHESRGWRDGGAKAGAKVTVRRVDPDILRRKVER